MMEKSKKKRTCCMAALFVFGFLSTSVICTDGHIEEPKAISMEMMPAEVVMISE